MPTIPVVRRLGPLAPGPLPRWWFYGRPISTHQLNAMFLVLPRAERFMLHAVRPAIAALDPAQPEQAALRQRARAFCAQEALHANAHERAEPLLVEQGLDIGPAVAVIAQVFSGLARWLPQRAKLALTVGLEHYGAIIGAELLAGGHTAHAHRCLRALLEWHAVEEIEHRAVTFDLWQATGGGWLGRVLGFVGATLLQGGFRLLITRRLLAADDTVTPEAIAENRTFQRRHPGRRQCLWRAWRTFLRPGFHPDELDDDALIARFGPV